MKYRVGDKVRIKSLNWWRDTHKEIDGFSYIGLLTETGYGINFIPEMKYCCGQTFVILAVKEIDGTYRLNAEAGDYVWCADMFEEEDLEIGLPRINDDGTLRRIIKGLDAETNLSSLYLYVQMLKQGKEVIVPEVGNDGRATVIAMYIKELREQFLNLREEILKNGRKQ